MSHGTSGRNGQQADINMVPMIDILLVMIIIFMLQVLTVIEVQIPPPAKGVSGADTDDIVLTIDADGGYAVNTLPVPRDSLGDRLREIFDARPRKLLLIQPHRTQRYRDVVTAMDIARGAGVQTLSLMPHAGPETADVSRPR